jgi:hypothetical protein
MKNTLAVFALFALTAAACDRTPLRTIVLDGASETAVDTSSATATKTDTVSATQTTTVQTTAIQTVSDTVTSIDTATSIVTTTPTATVTTTATETQSDTVPVTVSQTATDTNTETIFTNGCKVGATVDIGNGIDPSIAGSNSGFGIIWKDNTLMPAQMNHGMFARVDIGGNKKSAGLVYLSTEDIIGERIGIATMMNGYALSMDYPGLDQRSNFMMAGFDGTMSALVNNQPVTEPIVGSNNEGFTFLDQGEGYPALHQVQISTNALVDEKVFQWGAKAAFKTTNGAQGGGTWAFGMSQAGQAMIIVVKDGGIYPNVVNPVDNATGGFVSLDKIVLDSIVATDTGYVMAWWYTAPGTNWMHYLSFVPYDGTPDGIVRNTIEVMGWTGSNSGARHDSLAWNGKYIGLLAANPVVGETNLLLFRNDGTQVGDTINIFKDDTSRQKYDAADLAASGSTFGIVSTSSSGDKAQFTPVACQ